MRLVALLLLAACVRPEAKLPPPSEASRMEAQCEAAELQRRPSPEVRALLDAGRAATRTRAALAAGRIGDAQAKGRLAQLLLDPEAGETAAWALGRIEGGQVALLRCLSQPCPSAAAAARAWGRQGLPAAGLAGAFDDADWRVRVEAARGLATAPGALALLASVVPRQTSPHVLVALSEAAAQLGKEALPAISFTSRALTSNDVVVRCAAAAELELIEPARAAMQDPDARVRGATAGAAGPALADELRRLLADPDPYVVQEAAGALAKDPSAHFVQNARSPTRDAALMAVRRLEPAHARAAGDAESDALTALVELTGPLPQLLPTPNAALAAALAQPPQPLPVPPEARAMRGARRLRLRTTRGDLVIDLRPDVAPLTSSALAALAARHFYDGLSFHRVVPDFVVQGGDPRGDGDGGPGWALPDEHSPLRFLRGTLGIATSGPETGGSQIFLCHSPQPHLDGRYTIAGQLAAGDDVLDALEPGDTILSATPEL